MKGADPTIKTQSGKSCKDLINPKYKQRDERIKSKVQKEVKPREISWGLQEKSYSICPCP